MQVDVLQMFQKKMKSIGNNIDNTGTKAVNFGRTMTTRVTTPIVAGLGYAARACKI